jgi:antirestriction protein ArdC
VPGAPGEREAFAARCGDRPCLTRRPPTKPSPTGPLYQEITDKIIAELEQGRLPWVQPWAGVSAPLGLPRNAATGRAYSGINILILWCAVAERGFTGQTWLTLRQALKLGGHAQGRARCHDQSFLSTKAERRSTKASGCSQCGKWPAC